MKFNIMKKWVKALRSGKYIQGINNLKYGNEYCCLGVLTDLKAKENKKSFDVTTGGKGASLCESVMKWSGVKSERGDVNDLRGLYLSKMNDSGQSFKEIATFIEKNYKKL